MSDVRTLPVGEDNEEIKVTLDELAREGARRMIAAALEAEVDEYVARFAEELDDEGHRFVVRNGRGKERRVTVGSGTLPIRAAKLVHSDHLADVDGHRCIWAIAQVRGPRRRGPTGASSAGACSRTDRS